MKLICLPRAIVLSCSLVLAGHLFLPIVDPVEAESVAGEQPASESVVRLRRAILGQESGGKFDAVNPHSGALGYAQLMPANVKAWGQEAVGYAPSKQEFLSKPELQLQIIDHKLGQYWQEELQTAGGDEQTAVMRVASRWYSGNANLYTSTRKQYTKGHEYPSIASYSNSIWLKYQGAK